MSIYKQLIGVVKKLGWHCNIPNIKNILKKAIPQTSHFKNGRDYAARSHPKNVTFASYSLNRVTAL